MARLSPHWIYRHFASGVVGASRSKDAPLARRTKAGHLNGITLLVAWAQRGDLGQLLNACARQFGRVIIGLELSSFFFATRYVLLVGQASAYCHRSRPYASTPNVSSRTNLCQRSMYRFKAQVLKLDDGSARRVWLELCVHLPRFGRGWSTSLTMSWVMYLGKVVIEPGSCDKLFEKQKPYYLGIVV